MGNVHAVDNVKQERWHDIKSNVAGGTASVHGKRSSMEDSLRAWRHEAPIGVDGSSSDVNTIVTTHAAVCDGHSGSDVAIRVAHMMPRYIRGPQTVATTKRAFVDIDLALSAAVPPLRAGSTAVVVSVVRAEGTLQPKIDDLTNRNQKTNDVADDGMCGQGGGSGGEGKATRKSEFEEEEEEENEGDENRKQKTRKFPLRRSTRRRGAASVGTSSERKVKSAPRGRRKRKPAAITTSQCVAKKGRVSDTDREGHHQKQQPARESDINSKTAVADRVDSQTRVEICEPRGDGADDDDRAAIASGYYVTVGWVGDARCVILGPEGELLYVTSDHQPGDAFETARISAAGACVDYSSGGGGPRVYSYNVARMFGDFDTRKDAIKLQLPPQLQAISCAPDVARVWVPAGGFVIAASDGLVERLNTLQIVAALKPLIAQGCLPETMARFLAQLALASGSEDNVSVIVMHLQGQGEPMSAGVKAWVSERAKRAAEECAKRATKDGRDPGSIDCVEEQKRLDSACTEDARATRVDLTVPSDCARWMVMGECAVDPDPGYSYMRSLWPPPPPVSLSSSPSGPPPLLVSRSSSSASESTSSTSAVASSLVARSSSSLSSSSLSSTTVAGDVSVKSEVLARLGFEPADLSATGDAVIETGVQTLALSVPTVARPIDACSEEARPMRIKDATTEQRLWWREVLDEGVATHPLLLLHTRTRARDKLRESADGLRRELVRLKQEDEAYTKKFTVPHDLGCSFGGGGEGEGEGGDDEKERTQVVPSRGYEEIKTPESEREAGTGHDVEQLRETKRAQKTRGTPFPSRGVTTWAQVCGDRHSARMIRATLDVDANDNTGGNTPHIYRASAHGWCVHAIAWMSYPQRDSHMPTIRTIAESPTATAAVLELKRSIELLCAKLLSRHDADSLWSLPATYTALFDAFDVTIRPPEDGERYRYWQGAALGIMAYRIENTPAVFFSSSSSSSSSLSSSPTSSPPSPSSSLLSSAPSLPPSPSSSSTSPVSHISKIVVARTRHIDLQLLRRHKFACDGEQLAAAEWTDWKVLQAPNYCASFAEDHGDRGQATLLGNRRAEYSGRVLSYRKVEVEVSERSRGLESGELMVMCTRPIDREHRTIANRERPPTVLGADLRSLYHEWWLQQSSLCANHIAVGVSGALTPTDAYLLPSDPPRGEYLSGDQLIDVQVAWEPRLAAELVDDPRVVAVLRRYYDATLGVATSDDRHIQSQSGVRTKVVMWRVVRGSIRVALAEIRRKIVTTTRSVADQDRDIERLTEYIRAAAADGFVMPPNNMPLVLPLRTIFHRTFPSSLLSPPSLAPGTSSSSPSLSTLSPLAFV